MWLIENFLNNPPPKLVICYLQNHSRILFHIGEFTRKNESQFVTIIIHALFPGTRCRATTIPYTHCPANSTPRFILFSSTISIRTRWHSNNEPEGLCGALVWRSFWTPTSKWTNWKCLGDFKRFLIDEPSNELSRYASSRSHYQVRIINGLINSTHSTRGIWTLGPCFAWFCSLECSCI